jgi:hypothetical protein
MQYIFYPFYIEYSTFIMHLIPVVLMALKNLCAEEEIDRTSV